LAQSSVSYLLQQGYLVVQYLGSNKTRKTYLVQDQRENERYCILKKFILLEPIVNFEQVKSRFENIATKLCKLSHPQIAQIYDYFIEENGFYLLEEYVKGDSLSEQLYQKGKLTEKDIESLLRESLPVLTYLHRNQVLHGNLITDNLLRPPSRFSLNTEDAIAVEVTVVRNQGSFSHPLAEDNQTTSQQIIENPWVMENKPVPVSPRSPSPIKSPSKPEPLTDTMPSGPLGRGSKIVLLNTGEKQLFTSSVFAPAEDIYQLGITCIHLLTGCLPCTDEAGNWINPLYDSQQEQWLWREYWQQQDIKISERLQIILEQMVQPQLENRYQNAADIITALYSPTLVSPPSKQSENVSVEPEIIPKVSLTSSRRNFLQMAGWGSVGFIATVSASYWLRSQSEPWKKLLKPFAFETLTVNERGEVIKREKKQAKSVIVDLGNNINMEFVGIPGGEFQIGSPKTEKHREPDEAPQKLIQIPSFFLGKYLVTQAQWQAVMGNNPSYFKGANLPVEKVSWGDCIEFTKKLSKIIGKPCRLASESEWEYACRAGTTTAFYCGQTITPEIANYNGQITYLLEAKGLNRERTTEVGSFPPNPFGLYDMYGNVWEWCQDNKNSNYLGIPKNGKPWININNYRSLRGGSWLNESYYCRSANRNFDSPNVNLYNYGFRVATIARMDFLQ
jgi:formylglycine-generating enzyme required for sulfatase activity